jgi:uracil-DNA glycosylase
MKNIADLIGEEWAEFLPKAGELIEPIRKQLQEERKVGYLIHPEKENIFRIFREIPPSGVKVIWLGQDPYGSPPGQATGRAFECGKFPSPSWRKIAEIYLREVPDYDPQVSAGLLDKWASQGVFLVNKALTVRHQMPNSHTKLWESFTQYVLSSLVNDIVHPKAIILLGQKAQRTMPKEVPPHKVFAFEHPAASSYQGRPWKGDGVFTETKKFLNLHQLELNW